MILPLPRVAFGYGSLSRRAAATAWTKADLSAALGRGDRPARKQAPARLPIEGAEPPAAQSPHS